MVRYVSFVPPTKVGRSTRKRVQRPLTRTRASKGRRKQPVVLVRGGDPTGPSDEEWQSMTELTAFRIKDPQDDTVSHEFPIGKTALILPEGIDPSDEIEPCDYWVGKIKDIRVRNSEDDVWVQVQWFWSASEVSANVGAFDDTVCGKYERLLADVRDYVHAACFQALVNVIPYDETDIDQDPIDKETFYYRYKYNVLQAKITPPSRGSCICNTPYSPDVDELMYFCPRVGCQKWFHLECLVRANWLETKSDEERGDILQVTADEDVPIPKRMKSPDIESSSSTNVQIPDKLLSIARSSIIKGVAASSIVGNMQSVLHAREIVRKASQGVAVPTDWHKTVALRRWATFKTALESETQKPRCPSCDGTI